MSSIILSIIVPCYNVKDYLVECVESFREALNDRCECILIDDASTDGTAEIIRGYENCVFLRSVYNAENIGLGMTRNKGLEIAEGEYVLFLDSDDWLLPGAIDVILENLDKSYELIIFDYMRFFPKLIGSVRSPHASSLANISSSDTLRGKRALAVALPPMACFRVYSKKYIRRCGAEFGAGYYEDIFWSVKLLSLASKIYVIERVLYAYRMRPGSILRSKSNRHLCILLEYQKSLEFSSSLDDQEIFDIVLVNAINHYIFLLFENKSRMSVDDRVSLMKQAANQVRLYSGVRNLGFRSLSGLNKILLAIIFKGNPFIYKVVSALYPMFYIPFRCFMALVAYLSGRLNFAKN